MENIGSGAAKIIHIRKAEAGGKTLSLFYLTWDLKLFELSCPVSTPGCASGHTRGLQETNPLISQDPGHRAQPKPWCPH